MATILVVDDRPTNRQYVSYLATYAGHRVVEARDGVEALAAAHAQPFDLVISDILMPAMNGFDLVRRLRADPATQTVPVIFYTAGYMEDEAHAFGRRYSVDLVLAKPTEPEVLLKTIQDALQLPVPLPPCHDELPEMTAHASLVEGIHMSVARLTAVLEQARVLSGEQDSVVLLQHYCHASRALVGADFAACGTLEGDEPFVRTVYSSGGKAGNGAKQVTGPQHEVLDRLLRGGDAIRLADVAGTALAPPLSTVGSAPRPFLGVCLRTSGRPFGWLYFTDTPGGHAFTDEDERIAAILAAHLSATYENVRMYEQTRRLNAELEERVRERTAELEAANRALETSNRDLQASNRELEAFSYSVSHDLRSPLRGVHGYTMMLLEDHADRLDEDGRFMLAQVRDSAVEMGRLIDALLTFSRIGRREIQTAPVDMTKIVGEVCAALGAAHPARRLDFHVGSLPPAEGDPELLVLVWRNLLDNAVKFTAERDPAVIEVGTAERAPGVRKWYVRDNGAGFDARYREKLFHVFQRLHRAEDYPGTGVGLALVRRIVERHGGEVRAEGEVDRGATFYFSLPAVISTR